MANKIKGLTISINGETAGLDKALSGVNKKSRDLQKELRDVEKLLRLDPGNTELLEQKQKLLADSIANTKEKLDTLKTSAEQAYKQLEKGEISEEQFRALQREVIKTEENLKKLEKQSKEFGSVFSQQLKNAGKDMQEFGSKVSGVGKGLSKGVTTPIVAIGAASQVAFNEIDTALDTIVTKTGASGEAMDDLEASFNAVYGNMPVDAQAAGDAIGEVNTQFALTGEALEKASTQVLKFAEINGQDVTSTTTDAKEAMEAYGLSANDLDGVLDAVTKTAQNTGVATDKIFDSVVKGAPQLKGLGLDFAQSSELMGRFEQKGIDGTKVLSYLAKAQVGFAKDGKTMSEGLEELTDQIANSSSETEALTLASEHFGTKGASFMLDAIQRGALDFEDFQGAAESAAGAVTSTFEGTLDPIDNTKTAMNNLKIVGTEIAKAVQETLAPMLEKVVESLRSFAEWFKNLDPSMKEFIVKAALIAAALGPLLIVAGKIISGIGVIMQILPLLAGPVGIVIAIVAALIAIGVLLYKNWDTIKEKIGAAIEAVKGFFDSLGQKVAEVWDSIKASVKNGVDTIKYFFTVIVPGAISTMVAFFASLPGKIWQALLSAITKIREWGTNISQWAQTELPGIILEIVSFFAELPGRLFSIGVDMIKGLWEGIQSMISWLWEKVTGFIDGLVDGIKSKLKIRSPSRVFADIGENMAAGIGVGFVDQMRAVAQMINDAIPVPEVNVAAAGAGGGGLTIHQTNNFGGSYKPRDGAAAVRDLNRKLGKLY